MNEIKNELLKQDGSSAAEAEVAQLRKMVETEDRRARRLMRWAIATWLLFFVIVVVSVGLPIVAAALSRSSAPAGPAGVPVPIQSPTHHQVGVFAAILAVILGAAFFAMPIIAIVLTIMAMMARRTASKRQIIAALASIEAQLRLLTSTQARSPEG